MISNDINPRVSIVMAIYRPKISWFIEQLLSLNNQSYQNLELLIWNDCPEDETDYYNLVSNYITKFQFSVFKGNKNLGSNGAFSELIKLVTSEYIVFCDQDDIWLPEKIQVLYETRKVTNADLLCSDMYVIDEDSNLLANSIVKVRKHQLFYYGEDVFGYLLKHNFVTGCTMFVKATFAKEALPIPNTYFHDWWIALYVAARGCVKVVDRPLIKYRIHTTNQSEFLKGIYSKSDYFNKWIMLFRDRIFDAYRVYVTSEQKAQIDVLYELSLIRCEYFRKFSVKNFLNLIKAKCSNRKTIILELMLPFIPNSIFKILLDQIRKGRI